jgi:hypothetical protein
VDREPNIYADETINRLLSIDLKTDYPSNFSNSTHQVMFLPDTPGTLAIVQVYVEGKVPGRLHWSQTPVWNSGYAIERVCGPEKKH